VPLFAFKQEDVFLVSASAGEGGLGLVLEGEVPGGDLGGEIVGDGLGLVGGQLAVAEEVFGGFVLGFEE